jgi:hypothetical protein
MTPKEKANDILDNFWLMDKVEPMLNEEQAKQCALIAVDELICNSFYKKELQKMFDKGYLFIKPETECKEYWQEVKTKIQKHGN